MSLNRLRTIAKLVPPPVPRTSPTAASLLAMAAARDGASVIEPGAVVAIDLGDGRNLRVRVARKSVQISAELAPTRFHDEEHGRWEDDPHANDAVLDAATDLAEELQLATGWHVQSKFLESFEPIGPCLACGIELFERQSECGACGAIVRPDEIVPVAAEDETPRARICTLSRPDERDAPPWQRPPASFPIATLLAAMQSAVGFQLTYADENAAAVIIASARERLHVSVHRDSVVIDVPRVGNAAVSETARLAALGVARSVQGVTGWAPHSMREGSLESTGVCTACGRVLFVWQTHCACGRVRPDTRTRSEEIAHVLVDAAVRETLIEIDEVEHARESLEADVADAIRDEEISPAQLHALFMSHPSVAEVFGSELQVERITRMATRLADERMRAR